MGAEVAIAGRVLGLLDIRENERALVGRVLLLSLLLSGGNALLHTAAYALFLTEFGGEALPLIYIASSIVGVLVSFAYLRINERFPLGRVAVGTIGVLLAAVLLYRLALGALPGAWPIYGLPVFAALSTTLKVTLYWNLLGRLFTLQQGKRLFGLLGTGELIATTSVGLISPALVALVGTVNLLSAAAVGFLAALLLVARFVRAFATHLSDERAATVPQTITPRAGLLRNRYVLLIVGVLALYTISSYLIDNIFYIEVEQRFRDADQLASFLGIFAGVLGGLTLVLQVFVSGRVLDRYGVRPILIAAPSLAILGMAAAAGATLAGGPQAVLFWLAVVANLSIVAIDALDSPGFSLLYQVFPAAERTRVQTIVNGVIQPAAMGITGVILLVLYSVLQLEPLQAALLMLVFATAWLLLAVQLGREYPRQVQGALRKRLLSGSALGHPDRASLDLIRASLHHPRAGTVLYALELLEAFGPDEVLLVGADLLEHPAEEVRLRTLEVLERQHLVALLPAIMLRRGREPAPAVRGAIERAIAVLGGVDMIDEVLPALESTVPAVSTGAMIGLLRSGDMERMLLALERLQTLIQHSDPLMRLQAVQVLREAEVAALYRPIGRLLIDDDRRVLVASLQAVSRLGHPRLWPLVVRRVEVPGEREAAMNSLVAGGPGALPVLREAMRAPYRAGPLARARLLRLTRAAGRIGTPDAIEALLGLIDIPDLDLHSQVLRSLRRAGYHAGMAQAQQWAQQEVTRIPCLLRAASDVSAGPALLPEPARVAGLLTDAIDDAISLMRRNVFHCLAFVYDPALIKQIEDNLGRQGGDRAAREGRAFARETIETQIQPPLRHWIRPLLDEAPALQALNGHFPQPEMGRMNRLYSLCRGDEPWLPPWIRACALYLLACLEDERAISCAADARTSPEPVLRDSGEWALSRLQPATAGRHVDHKGEGDQMLTTVEKVIALKGVELFVGTPDDVLANLVTLLKQVDVPDGQRVFSKGDAGNSMYIIAAGRIRIHDGEAEFQQMGEGEVFGEMALLDPAARSAAATALVDSVLLELEAEPFYELLEDHSVISRRIIQLLTRRLRKTTSLAGASRT